MQNDPSKTYYLSGHLDLTDREFDAHYAAAIAAAFEEGARFVVGDARGADTMCQRALAALGCDRTTVYHMFESPRNNAWNFKTVGGFGTDEDRDAAMTAASDADIAWVRPGRERSGTAKNLQRRTGKGGQ